MDLKVVELFAGVGGFRVGLNKIESFDCKTGRAIEKNDWDFVWANQWEPSTKQQPAFECYEKRFSDSKNSNLDISQVDKSTIPDHTLLVGGFPCQDYSVARSLSQEMGIKGKKGVLWWDIKDVLVEKSPPFILLENVDRLLKSPASQRGRDFAIMLKTLDELGYVTQWRMINAANYGMPQKRRRVFIFATLKETSFAKRILELNQNQLENYLISESIFNKTFPIKRDSIQIKTKDLTEYRDVVDLSDNYKDEKFLNLGICVNGRILTSDFEENSNEKKYVLKDILKISSLYNPEDLSSYIIKDEEIEKWKYLKGAKRISRKSKTGKEYFYTEGNMSFPDSLDEPARTMLTSESTVNRSSHVIFDEDLNKLRKITEVEAELIQMFPANWTNTGMTRRQRYFMMGNALVTGIIAKLEPELRRIITEEANFNQLDN